VESHAEYRDNYLRDSVFVREWGDTVWIKKYKFWYKDKAVRDSVVINDTIRVLYPLEVPGDPVNYASGWQNFQIWLEGY
jgi:hypothetical protein